MYEVTIPILTFISVMSLGFTVIIARHNRNKAIRLRLGQAEGFGDEHPHPSPKLNFTEVMRRAARVVSKNGPSSTLRTAMANAGYHNFLAAEIFIGIKIFLFLSGIIFLSFLVLPLSYSLSVRLLLILGGAAMLLFIPNVVVSNRRRNRRLEFRQMLPEAIDLLEVCVTAGMGLDMAWNAVTDEIRRVSPMLGDEMALTNLEIHLGTQRAEAMKNMAVRTNADELSSLSGILAQSEQFGTSVADALRTFASSMRETRNQQTEEVAEKMAVKLLFPMIVFIFPAILIVTVGPAGLKLTEIFGG